MDLYDVFFKIPGHFDINDNWIPGETGMISYFADSEQRARNDFNHDYGDVFTIIKVEKV